MPESKLKPTLEEDKLVTAMTLEDEDGEYDRAPREVTGRLYFFQSPFEEWPPQCFVDGVHVDPDTVRLAKDT